MLTSFLLWDVNEEGHGPLEREGCRAQHQLFQESPDRGTPAPPTGGGFVPAALPESKHMTGWGLPVGTVRERSRAHARLREDLGSVMDDLTVAGFAHVPVAVPTAERLAILEEAARVDARFLPLPDRVNGVRQRAEQLSLRVGDPAIPAINDLIASLTAAVTSGEETYGLERFTPTEARFMRYRGGRAGLGAHRDGTCYWMLVAVYSLAGRATFTVHPDSGGPEPLHLLVQPGDLVLLRAPGFAGHPDGRPRHSVGPPLDGERISLTVRMVGRHGAPPA